MLPCMGYLKFFCDKVIIFWVLAKEHFISSCVYFYFFLTGKYRMMQIACSTVVQTIDFLFKQEIPVTGSGYGKKKKKSMTLQTSDMNSDMVCKGETVLCLLSSLLDILLLKKDIENRYAFILPLILEY